jgi:hypothetical protein
VDFVVHAVDGRRDAADVSAAAHCDEVTDLRVTEERLRARVPSSETVGEERHDEVRIAFVRREAGPPKAGEFAARRAERNDPDRVVRYGPRSVTRP